MTRQHRRYFRQIDRLQRRWPGFGGWLNRLLSPDRRRHRMFAAAGLMAGGVLGFLPVVGFWMFPLGLMLLAWDLPVLRAPVAALTIRGRALARRLRRQTSA